MISAQADLGDNDLFRLRYGDKSPKSLPARIFSIVWILVGLIVMAIFTANVTSALTALSLDTKTSSFANKKVRLIDY